MYINQEILFKFPNENYAFPLGKMKHPSDEKMPVSLDAELVKAFINRLAP